MSNYLKVEGHSNLLREMDSNAIVNTNISEYDSFMKHYMEKKREKDELRDAVRQINILKNEMYEIKSLILKLSDKN
tara:strand:- start:43 stop:270 length:228 start_codon:yes stop_codon:yes gene_type:complete